MIQKSDQHDADGDHRRGRRAKETFGAGDSLNLNQTAAAFGHADPAVAIDVTDVAAKSTLPASDRRPPTRISGQLYSTRFTDPASRLLRSIKQRQCDHRPTVYKTRGDRRRLDVENLQIHLRPWRRRRQPVGAQCEPRRISRALPAGRCAPNPCRRTDPRRFKVSITAGSYHHDAARPASTSEHAQDPDQPAPACHSCDRYRKNTRTGCSI